MRQATKDDLDPEHQRQYQEAARALVAHNDTRSVSDLLMNLTSQFVENGIEASSFMGGIMVQAAGSASGLNVALKIEGAGRYKEDPKKLERLEAMLECSKLATTRLEDALALIRKELAQ